MHLQGIHYGVFPGASASGVLQDLWFVLRPHNWHPKTSVEELVNVHASTGENGPLSLSGAIVQDQVWDDLHTEQPVPWIVVSPIHMLGGSSLSASGNRNKEKRGKALSLSVVPCACSHATTVGHHEHPHVGRELSVLEPVGAGTGERGARLFLCLWVNIMNSFVELLPCAHAGKILGKQKIEARFMHDAVRMIQTNFLNPYTCPTHSLVFIVTRMASSTIPRCLYCPAALSGRCKS